MNASLVFRFIGIAVVVLCVAGLLAGCNCDCGR